MFDLRAAGVLGATVALAGGVAYFVWNYFSPKETPKPPEKKTAEKSESDREEGEEDVKSEEVVLVAAVPNVAAAAPLVAASAAEELSVTAPETTKPPRTQVLVLGLDGAGKTSLLRSFTNSRSEQETQPTQGFNAVSINREDLCIEFLEIGGSEELRQYWQKYMPKALMMVFVVDSSNSQLFPLAKTHLHELLVSDPQLPLMVLANKQDQAGACNITDLHDALSLAEVGHRKLFVIGTYVNSEVEEPSSGIEDALEIIIQTVQMGSEPR